MAAMGQETAPRLHTVIDQEALSDDDGAFAYEELPEEFDDEDEDNLEDYNFLKAETKVDEAIAGDLDEGRALVEQGKEVVDDFIRNFFIRHEMKRSLDIFESEWYELQMMGKLRKADIEVVPSEYQRTHSMHHQLTHLRTEVEKARFVAEKAKSTWDKFRKERDFHRMHHKRVVQEKNKLLVDLKRLKRHYEQYEPTLTELRHKYEVAMKEKMLMRLERDRLQAKCDSLQKQLAPTTQCTSHGRQCRSGGLRHDLFSCAACLVHRLLGLIRHLLLCLFRIFLSCLGLLPQRFCLLLRL